MSILSVLNVATPATAATVVAPDSVPVAGLVPIATVTLPVNVVTRFPEASRTLTCTAGVIGVPAWVVVGCPVNATWLAGPAVTVTTADCVSVTPATTAPTVFAPATVELTLPAATPDPSVGAAGWVSRFPLPDAVSTTVAPLTGLLFASRAVTVIVDAPLPALIPVGTATTVDWVAETVPARMSKAALVALRPVAAAIRV